MWTPVCMEPTLKYHPLMFDVLTLARNPGVRHAGGIRSANADISNDKAGEKPARRKTKGSCPTLIGAG